MLRWSAWADLDAVWVDRLDASGLLLLLHATPEEGRLLVDKPEVASPHHCVQETKYLWRRCDMKDDVT